MPTGVDGRVIEGRTDEALWIRVPELVLALMFAIYYDVVARVSFTALDVEHLAGELADDEELAPATISGKQ